MHGRHKSRCLFSKEIKRIWRIIIISLQNNASEDECITLATSYFAHVFTLQIICVNISKKSDKKNLDILIRVKTQATL